MLRTPFANTDDPSTQTMSLATTTARRLHTKTAPISQSLPQCSHALNQSSCDCRSEVPGGSVVNGLAGALIENTRRLLTASIADVRSRPRLQPANKKHSKQLLQRNPRMIGGVAVAFGSILPSSRNRPQPLLAM